MAEAPAGVVLRREPEDGVRNADFVYTDVWVIIVQKAVMEILMH